jgi:hypothetical protein
MVYRAEAQSIAGFVQQLAVSYLGRGYWFYVSGWVPQGKEPRAVDDKLIRRYGIGISRWTRARRKAVGSASLQYLRYGRFFLILATHGQHRFFDEEKSCIRDARRVPIRFHGYSISYRAGHPHVRIAQARYLELKAHFTALARRGGRDTLEAELGQIPFEPYAPVRRQLLCILRAVNRARRDAGLEPVEATCLRLRRRIYRPFEMREWRSGILEERREAERGMGRGLVASAGEPGCEASQGEACCDVDQGDAEGFAE